MKPARKRIGRIWPAVCLCVLLSLLAAAPLAFSDAGPREKAPWQGVDEAVMGRIAREQGREARPPLIRTDLGDLPLFVFFLAGASGGFAAGYYWRKLLERRGR